jgi:agmatinase
MFTMPEMDLVSMPFAEALEQVKRVAGEIVRREKFLLTLGGEHSITPPLVSAVAARHKGLSVLQIDAHAD